MNTAWTSSLTSEKRTSAAWVLVLVTLVGTFGFADRIIVQVLVQPIKAELHVSDAQMGLLGGLTFAVLYGVLSIPIARLAERKSRVAIISISTVLWALATTLSGFANSFTQLLGARVAVGVGEAGGTPATTSLISDYFPRERRGSALAFYNLAIPFGVLLGASAGGYISQHWGWRAAFLLVGGPGVLLALLQWTTIREPARGQHDPGVDVDTTPPFTAVLERFAARPALVNIVLGAMVSTVAGYGISYFLAAYLTRRYGLNYAQAGLMVGLIQSGPTALSIMLGGFVGDWAGRRAAHWYALIPALGSALAAPLCITAFQSGTWVLAAAFLALASLFQYAYIPAVAALTQNMMEPRMRASATALTALLYTLVGQGTGPLLVGMLSDHIGLESALIRWSLLFVLASALLALSARTLARDLTR